MEITNETICKAVGYCIMQLHNKLNVNEPTPIFLTMDGNLWDIKCSYSSAIVTITQEPQRYELGHTNDTHIGFDIVKQLFKDYIQKFVEIQVDHRNNYINIDDSELELKYNLQRSGIVELSSGKSPQEILEMLRNRSLPIDIKERVEKVHKKERYTRDYRIFQYNDFLTLNHVQLIILSDAAGQFKLLDDKNDYDYSLFY